MHYRVTLLLSVLFWSATCEERKIENKHVNSYVDRLHRTRRSTLLQPWILLDEERQEFIDAHNFHRKRVQPQAANMREVEWDEDLEQLATNYSRNCDFFNHRVEEERKTPGFTAVGENIARWGSFDVNKIIEAWDMEKEDYNFQSATCKQGKVCGHYTQLVWWESYKIGCGVSLCERLLPSGLNGFLFVCNYAPTGNIRYANRNSPPVKPYKEGEPASACDSAFPRKNDGLCSKYAGGQAIISSNPKTTLLCLIGIAMHFFYLFV